MAADVGHLYLILGCTLKFCDGLAVLRIAIVLGVIGAGVAVFGAPGPWNLLLCAAVALPVAFQAWRTAQDDADLENL